MAEGECNQGPHSAVLGSSQPGQEGVVRVYQKTGLPSVFFFRSSTAIETELDIVHPWDFPGPTCRALDRDVGFPGGSDGKGCKLLACNLVAEHN